MWFFRFISFMFFCFLFFFLYLFLLFFFLFCFYGGGFILDFFLFSLSGFEVSLSFIIDYVSLGFFLRVSFISSMVFLYSLFYIRGTVDSRRFLWLVFGFVSSMFFLVFSGNFFMTIVGWDGLGLISFCLVIFYSNHGRLESGLVTVFRNRVGDVFFLMCFFFFVGRGGFLFDVGSFFDGFLFFIFLFLGAITKRAQIPFSAWLPAAIAAPTPVSSLVHSSTLVTAGVYVLIRFFYIFSSFRVVFIKFFFILTILVAGVCANIERDFKKVVAISTLSQLGMMLFILSVGVWVLSFLHMVIHAFFKRMLFLRTGSLMSHLGGNQDSRFYGRGAVSWSSFLFFFSSCVCLAGFPFYIGFYSKDFIILRSSFFLGIFFYFLFLIGCLFTIFYSFRLILMGYCSWYKGYSFSFYEERRNFLFPVTFLFFKSWLLGGVFYWCFLRGRNVFFCFFDVFVGLILILAGIFFYKFFSLFYHLFFYFCLISFIRWFSSRGRSFLLGKKVYHKWDGRWLEVLGGQGVFSQANALSLFFDFYKKIGLGVIVIFLSFFGLLFFIYFFSWI